MGKPINSPILFVFEILKYLIFRKIENLRFHFTLITFLHLRNSFFFSISE